MSSQQLKNEIAMLKRVLNPDYHETRIHFSFGNKDTPHGCFNGNTLVITSLGEQWFEAETLDSEMERFTKAEYDDMIKHHPFMKADVHPFSTYDKWLDYHRCKCGKHGPKGDQPYYGEDK